MTVFLQICSIELRKVLAYRSDFWVNTVGSVLTQVVVAAALWTAVFAATGQPAIGGYSQSAMIIYALLAGQVFVCVQGEPFGMLSTEIYDGSLTRYLIYPVDLLRYKWSGQCARILVALGQLTVLLALVRWCWPGALQPMWWHWSAGLLAIVGGAMLHFWIACCLELVAFWADNVWSFQALLRMAVQFLGGMLLPLSVFPAWAHPWLQASPFAGLVALPVETLLGRVTPDVWLLGMARQIGWTLCFWALARALYRRGIRHYSGVGM